MLHLLMQPQKELQLDLKTNKTQNYQEIKLNGSPTTKDLKKPCLSRQVGEAEMRRDTERQQQNGQSPIQVWWIKIRRVTLGVSDPSPRLDHTAQGSSARKIDSYNFWL